MSIACDYCERFAADPCRSLNRALGCIDYRARRVRSITCPKCSRTSYHPEDVRHRFCGACNEFHRDMLVTKLYDLLKLQFPDAPPEQLFQLVAQLIVAFADHQGINIE